MFKIFKIECCCSLASSQIRILELQRSDSHPLHNILIRASKSFANIQYHSPSSPPDAPCHPLIQQQTAPIKRPQLFPLLFLILLFLLHLFLFFFSTTSAIPPPLPYPPQLTPSVLYTYPSFLSSFFFPAINIFLLSFLLQFSRPYSHLGTFSKGTFG